MGVTMPTTISAKPMRERRRDTALRDIFEDAYERCLPFLDPERGIRGIPLVHQAIVTLRESYPHLDMLQVYVLVQALQRTVQTRRRQNQTSAGGQRR
jgi:hypothetical protein